MSWLGGSVLGQGWSEVALRQSYWLEMTPPMCSSNEVGGEAYWRDPDIQRSRAVGGAVRRSSQSVTRAVTFCLGPVANAVRTCSSRFPWRCQWGLKMWDVGSVNDVKQVSRIWDAINMKSNEFISLDMVLVDEKENVICASIWKNHVKKIKPLLSEGGIYAIKNFKVSVIYGEFHPVKNEHRIFFKFMTIVKRLDGGVVKILMHGF
ncbi:hypothetical protein Sjap_020011 [Stephania japonica]|uniref:Replication protein A 70 kDa DNA-binding subunit B/D first OB fold domain-containing protein n=1 Tax=Stephania japonica TaxID=461633 RepID=A0AAP0F2Q3_9MAGN